MPEAMEEDDFPTLTSPPMPYPCLPDRNRWGLLIGCLIALGLTVVSPRSRVVHASSLRNSAIVQAVSTARPAVVNIHGRKTLPAEYDVEGTADAGHQVNGMGTGIIIDERGYIITNYHVVEGVKRIRATLADGTTVVAELVANDPKTDLAIIKVPDENEFPVIRLGTVQRCDAGRDGGRGGQCLWLRAHGDPRYRQCPASHGAGQ